MSNDMKQRYDEITSESKKQEEEWNEMYLLIGDLTERQLNILHSVVVNELNWINSEGEDSTE
jgi:tetrahydromethanopterin S-methyltransferase subunit G